MITSYRFKSIVTALSAIMTIHTSLADNSQSLSMLNSSAFETTPTNLRNARPEAGVVTSQGSASHTSSGIIRSPHGAISSSRHQPTQSTSDNGTMTSKFIVEFNGITTPAIRDALNARLQILSQGNMELLKEDALSNTEVDSKNCVLVNADQLALLQANTHILNSFKVIGKQSLQFSESWNKTRPALQSSTPVYHAPSSQSSRGITGTTYSSYYFSQTNPNPTLLGNYIPDLGYQELGQWFTDPSVLTVESVITSVWYRASFYHTHPGDLKISIGYDDISLGGSTNIESVFWNRVNSASDYNTYTGTTHAFDGYYPDAWYYIAAVDQVAVDSGYLDQVEFEVYWKDAPDLQIYSGSGSVNDYQFDGVNGLAVQSSVANVSTINADTTFGVSWYLAPTNTGSCTNANYSMTTNYYLGYIDIVGGLNSNFYDNLSLPAVNLDTAVNSLGQHMPSGKYCVWVIADDLDQIDERDESNNSAYFSTPITFSALPTGIKDHNNNALAAKIFPNPTQDVLHIEFNAEFNNNTNEREIQITNMNGQVVYSQKVQSEKSITISVSDFAPGVYFLSEVTTNGRTSSLKFVKN